MFVVRHIHELALCHLWPATFSSQTVAFFLAAYPKLAPNLE